MSEKSESTKGTNTAKAETMSKRYYRIPTRAGEISCSMLLEDTTLNCAPSHLLELLKHFNLKNCTEAEILFQLIYLIALESGFAEEHVYNQCINDLYNNYMGTVFFDSRNVNCLAKRKPSFIYDNIHKKFYMNLISMIVNQERNFILSGIVSGDLMIVTLTSSENGIPINVSKAFSVCLDIPRYIITNSWKNIEHHKPYHNNDHHDDGHYHYHPLNKSLSQLNVLSYILRDELFVPSKIEHLAMTDLPLYPGILGLPIELYDNIFHYLSPNQLRILANVCKRLNNLIVNSKHYQRAPTTLRRKI